ncbi:MAG TPA: hypothetical protein VIV58_27410 [Kofleriaceae bacterium]
MRWILIVGFLASTAFASPKYTRKQDLHLDAKFTPRAKPLPRPEPHAPEARTPAVSADDVLDLEDKAAPLRAEQEAILIQLAADTPDTDSDKPDYLFRLAEQYALQLRHWRLRATEASLQHD